MSERASHNFADVIKLDISNSFSSKPLPYFLFITKSRVWIAGFDEALLSAPLPSILNLWLLYGGVKKGVSISNISFPVPKATISLLSPVVKLCRSAPLSKIVLPWESV